MSLVKRFTGETAVRNLSLILLLYLSVALAYGVVTPLYEGPDEIGHVLYAKHIVEGRGIPVQSREYAIAYGFGQEGSQSPLYYALSAGLVRVLGCSLAGLEGVPPVNPFTTCGRPEGGYNVARYRHDPHQEAFPYQDAARAVHVMRLFSALLGAVTVVAVYAATCLAFPHAKAAAPLGAVLVAFNPQFAFMGGVVNNDNLVNCLTALAVALTLYCLRHGFTWRRTVVLGLACGLAPLAKLGGLMALAFSAMGLLIHLKWQVTNSGLTGPKAVPSRLPNQGRARLGLLRLRAGSCRHQLLRFIGRFSLLVGVFLAVAGWWFVRNWVLYGDPTGTNMLLSIYGGRGGWPAHLVLPELLDTFRSYWAAFACELRFPSPSYWVFGLPVGLGVVGWIRGWRTISRQSRHIVALLLFWLGLVVVSWVRWNQITYAPLGRLFFQANAAIGALLGCGLAQLTPRPRRVLVGMGAGLWTVALAGALTIVRPAFGLPDRHPASDPPTPPQTLPQAAFADLITAWGYGVSPRSLEPGESLNIGLFLQARTSITEDYALALQLLSPVPGDDTTLVNFNTIPGGGNYPTYAWQPDEVVVDRYRLLVPAQVMRTQAWRVGVIFYRLSDGERLPVAVADQPAGEALELGLVRVGASEPLEVPPEAYLEPATVFGQAIALQGARVSSEEDALQVALWWETLAAPEVDYTVFVHLVDGEGRLVGTGDGPPRQGGFPTRMWRPGDQVHDAHTILLPPDIAPGVYVIRVGWYDPVTGVRLPAVQEGERLPQDGVTLPSGLDRR